MLFAGCDLIADKAQPVDYVNNRIGNISHLLVPTYPTAQLPNSMLRMNPDHNEFTTDRMGGLPLNVPSHRQGSVLMMMPFSGDESVIKTHFGYRYDQEKTEPYRYSVLLDDFMIAVDFAPAEHSAIFSCTFEQTGGRYIQLRTNGGELHGEGNALWGWDTYHGIKHYFYLEFEEAPETFSGTNGDAVRYASFSPSTGPSTIKARYGGAYIDSEQAKRHMLNEITAYDIEAVVEAGRKAWNKTLGKIRVEGGTEDERTTFYTALYRCHERMINISEEGRYFSGFDKQIHDDEGEP